MAFKHKGIKIRKIEAYVKGVCSIEHKKGTRYSTNRRSCHRNMWVKEGVERVTH